MEDKDKEETWRLDVLTANIEHYNRIAILSKMLQR